MKGKIISKIVFIFLIFMIPFLGFSEEKTINVGWYIQSKYQEITDSGSPFGFNYDYLQEISEYTGWKYNFILDSFDNCMEMLEDGKIDVLGCIIQSDERVLKFNFPELLYIP
mgnify:FL=1